jgi:superfamily II DNA helicase RecQ
LANEHFRTAVLAGVAGRIALLVIDRHCISDWGRFGHYRLLERLVRVAANLRLLATATEQPGDGRFAERFSGRILTCRGAA